MDALLKKSENQQLSGNITISGSKSESNRLLILKELYNNITIENLSNSDDTKVMQHILSSTSSVANVHHAGTAMRFLTAYFALHQGIEKTITGSERMQQRPIKILVDALRDLGAKIDYKKEEGYPPILVRRTYEITKRNVEIQGNVSSQYISALMLAAPMLKNGLEIKLLGEITSVPYIKMTLALLHQVGVASSFKGNIIKIEHTTNIEKKTLVVESDWSSASYWYSLVALSDVGSKITLSAYKKDSLQGDSCLTEIYKELGVKTTFLKNSILLEKTPTFNPKPLTLNLKNAPDIAQTIAVTCFGLGISCDLSGLHTLKIKETDRLEALREELAKLGAKISVTNDSLHLQASKGIKKNIAIKTYDDHRMAMAFAPLALKVPITILNAEVVSKSYPDFWKDFMKIGIQVAERK